MSLVELAAEPARDTTAHRANQTSWSRDAVIYQIYVRSFADSDGDGVGDLAGITSRLDYLASLGVDAIWLTPFYRSPMADGGYDVADYRDIDPALGTLRDFDAMLAQAHARGLRVIIDVVPNHASSAHRWFAEALAAGPGSPQRQRFHFRTGGETPPNNWQSIFRGSAWTRLPDGDWYLHLFAPEQPDLNWEHPDVRAEFAEVLRFWLDRGVDGIRIDVAHGLVKKEGLPDWTPDPSLGMSDHQDDAPYWAQPGVHPIYRDWHQVLAEFGPDRVLIGEAWVEPLSKLAEWVRPDEMQQTFNFTFLETPWDAAALHKVVDDSLAAFGAVRAPSTWVLSNHDVIRHATRLALTPPPPQGEGLGPTSQLYPDDLVGQRRARAASAFMLALPGSAYLYQGEELGLPEVIDLPDSARQDPTFFRTGGKNYGRDGARVPIPWDVASPSAGFGPTGASWLPQPHTWPGYARDAQLGIPGSTLEFYREALAARRTHHLARNELVWQPSPDPAALVFRSGAVTVIANTGATPVALPAGRVVLASGAVGADRLPGDTTAWLVD